MILGTSRAVHVYAYPEPVDLRKRYDGLYGLVKNGLGRDPLGGDLFLFANKRLKGCKVLVSPACASFRSDSSAVSSRGCGATMADRCS